MIYVIGGIREGRVSFFFPYLLSSFSERPSFFTELLSTLINQFTGGASLLRARDMLGEPDSQ